jgi:NADH:ubiquinone oxidoreductase subunit C
MMNLPFSFVNNASQKAKHLNFMVPHTCLPYVATHFRFSTLFYSLQLVDIFAYEVLGSKYTSGSYTSNSVSKPYSTVVVYNFHSLYSQDRFFLFTSNQGTMSANGTRFSGSSSLASVTELFPAANWLEREASELHGVNFAGKKDLRNLMLQYGDSTAPFQKSFPSIGLREMYYEPLKDTIIQNPVTLQL